MKKHLFLISWFLFPFSASYAQNFITADDAVSIALKNNYDILVATNSAEIGKVNNTAGNAGMLPNVSINATDTRSDNNLDQKLSNGTETKRSNVLFNNFSSNVALSWTLFDGGKMFITKAKLNEIEALGELQFKEQVMQSVYDVTVAYYDVVRQKQELNSIHEVIAYNFERVKILQTSFNAGLTAKNNLLQAQIDLNVYQEDAINQQAVILSSKRALNQLIGRDSDVKFDVTDSIPFAALPDTGELGKKLAGSNPSILSLEKQAEIARLSIKELNTQRYPKLSFNAGYYYTKSNNGAGFQLYNQTFGPQFGGTLSIPIFQGGNNVRQVAAAKLEFESAKYDLENVKLQVTKELHNALTAYNNQLQLLNIEKVNDELAKENLEISLQRLRLGQTTALEVRQAQESYVDSRTRLINFMFNLKTAETKIKQLIAGL